MADSRPGGGPHVLVLPSWYPIPEAPEAGVFFREQAQALQAAGARVGVLYPEARSLRVLGPAALVRWRFQVRYAEEEGIPTYRMHGWNLFPRMPMGAVLWHRMAARLARRYVRRFGMPDLLHAHGAMWGGSAARRLAPALGLPYVVTEHFTGLSEQASGFAPGKMAGVMGEVRRALGEADAVVAVSGPLRDDLVREAGVPAERVQVLPNLVHTDYFHLPPEGARPAAPFRFVSVGSLERRKGFDVLLRAFAQAFPGDRGVVLEIAGAGPERGALETLAGELGIAERVRFAGQLDRAGIRALLWRSHAFALGSWVETFGVVLIEALATGLPIASTACGGPQDIVTRATGRLSPPGDADALAEGLRQVRALAGTADPAEIRRDAVERFSAPRVAARLLALYADVLRARGA
jgi:teichuronic acid biosynthesis glycosyltransferase TuaC